MADRDLRHLVQRRLYELGLTADQAARRSRGAAPRETIRGLLRGHVPGRISDVLAGALAGALDVPVHRVRRAAGLPVHEPALERTRPHLRLIRTE